MLSFLILTIKNLTLNSYRYRSVAVCTLPSRKPSQKTVVLQQTTCVPRVPCLAYYETAINTCVAERNGDSCQRSACLPTETGVRISGEGLKILPFTATCRINLGPVNSWYHSRFRMGQTHRSLRRDTSRTQQATLHVHRSVKTVKTAFLLNNSIYINPVRTSQETHYVPARKPNRLMLFGRIIAAYCENHVEHTNTLCAQNAEF
jgi:hypothetical protein